MKRETTLIETDSLDKENCYYLYEVKTDSSHYYIATSDEEITEKNGEIDFENHFHMHKREDFNNREWEIAKYLFRFLWDSSNGTNTCVEQDIYEEDGFNEQEITDFIDKFEFEKQGVLEKYEDGGVEIYWSYFSCFDLKSCDMFEIVKKEYLVVFLTEAYTDNYVVKGDTLEKAQNFVNEFNSNEKLVNEHGKVGVQVITKTYNLLS